MVSVNEQAAIQHLLNATETYLRNDAFRSAQTDYRDLALRFAEELRDESDPPSVPSKTPSHPISYQIIAAVTGRKR